VLLERTSLGAAPDALFQFISYLTGGERRKKAQALAKGEDGWCAAVDPNTSRCTIYEDRPAICRKYAMGSPSCRDERHKWFGNVIPTAVHVL